MRLMASTDARRVGSLLTDRARTPLTVQRRVAQIIRAVRAQGDRAVRRFATEFDGLKGPMELALPEIRREARSVPEPVRKAVALAARHIRAVAKTQVPKPWRTVVAPGLTIDHRVTPLDRIGCYVPAGRYPLPSSLLMTAIPARVAGVGEIVVACPRPDPTVLFAALEAGADRVFRIGGAHAIAALAYGTRSVPKVDKIVGPGSAYVAEAKSQVSRDCAIDFFAGPSEIVVVSVSGRPDWIAADLIAQAEHDVDARAILLTPSQALADAVSSECRRQLPRTGPAATSLRRNGGIVVTRSLDEAIELCQQMAPEHVVCDTRQMAQRLTRAGTVFVGRFSAQALGDYVTGSNHVLPTSGAARARSGLSASDFVRVTPIQTVTAAGFGRVGRAASILARAEGLESHAASVEIRMGAAECRTCTKSR